LENLSQKPETPLEDIMEIIVPLALMIFFKFYEAVDMEI